MGRAEVGTPKYLANKMKAKGLQKLRWYCQMCQKQCRDENGFKCHTMSESHQRQLLLFADNSGQYIYSFSKQFSDGYLEVLRRRFGTKRVAANKVYQEYISDKNHLHMNATRWLTLTDYIKWLGRTGQCIVDETEKGWFVTYIDRSPEAMEAQEKIIRKEKMDKDDQERMMEFVEKQIERNKMKEKEKVNENVTELQRDENKSIKLNIVLKKKSQRDSDMVKPLSMMKFDSKVTSKKSLKKAEEGKTEHNGALNEIMQIQEYEKEIKNRSSSWLAEGIIVKFKDKSLGNALYNKKCIITQILEKYMAKVKFLDTGNKAKVDQIHLETVIPAIGKQVLVVNGAYRGCQAIMKDINEKEFSVTIEISKGPLTGRIVNNVQYDDVSKLCVD